MFFKILAAVYLAVNVTCENTQKRDELFLKFNAK